MLNKAVEFILYVKDQEKSCEFYTRLLKQTPVLNVPGMTEFILNENCKLGLMPMNAIAKILSDKAPAPQLGDGIPRCELYLYIENIEEIYQNALQSGATIISGIEDRSWGDKVCYFADPDGHIIAFAQIK
jgi:lactoylglutathione lyase